MFEKKSEVKGDILTIRNDFPIRVGFLPDMHVGSTRAICTPQFNWKDAGGMEQTYIANTAQKMLYELWKRNIELFEKYGIQHIFIIGDTFQGENYAEKGAFNFIRKPQQIKLAADLLQEVYEGCNQKIDFYVWRGTKYHESPAGVGELHEGLVSELNRRGIPAKYMHQVSYIELHGGKNILNGKKRMRRIFIAHEAPTALVYPATLMSRDINWCLQSEASGQTLQVDAIIRAHLHTWLHVDHHGIHAVQLPCWHGYVPYKATIKYFFKLQPTVGGAMMLMDEYGRLQFWGGSFPFGFSREKRIQFHRLCMTECKLNPNERLPTPHGVNKKCLS
jgi:hypothetical protein